MERNRQVRQLFGNNNYNILIKALENGNIEMDTIQLMALKMHGRVHGVFKEKKNGLDHATLFRYMLDKWFENVLYAPGVDGIEKLYTLLEDEEIGLGYLVVEMKESQKQVLHPSGSSGSTAHRTNISPTTGDPPPIGPRHPTYVSENARFKSISWWSPPEPQQPQELVEAGFFYTGPSTQVKCFYCNGGLKSWETARDPWGYHQKNFPDCRFVKMRLNTEEIEKRRITRSSHHEGITCVKCLKESFSGRRFKCFSCDDFDLCGNCFTDGSSIKGHSMRHSVQMIVTGTLPTLSPTHEGITCGSCEKENFDGRRYECMTCANYNLCSACFNQGDFTKEHTPRHQMMVILATTEKDEPELIVEVTQAADVTTPMQPVPEKSPEEGKVTCNICKKKNIDSSRYFECKSCYDYHLCNGCLEKGEYNEGHTKEHSVTCIGHVFPDFPDILDVRRSGPTYTAISKYMGEYFKMGHGAVHNGRPMYKLSKTENERILFYSGANFWLIGNNPLSSYGWIGSAQKGLKTIPRTGWEYWNGLSCQWIKDPLISFNPAFRLKGTVWS